MVRARLAALAILVLAGLWIGSGVLRPAQTATSTPQKVERPLFRVVVMTADVMPHARRLVLTGRTQSDQRVILSARTNGIVNRLAVRRGAMVKTGDLIAELSDEAREANVTQAKARLAQRTAELDARETLAKRGTYPTLNLEQLRAEKQAAEAALATAEAELLRTSILAPIDGIVNDLSVEIGQGLQTGNAIAELIAPDPMLAVIELPERRLGGVKTGDKAEVKLITGQSREGEIRFVARRPTNTTRTYRVDIAFPNPDGAIADGVAAEVALLLAPVQAARVPRSALTFSAEGQLGIRFVDEASIVRFVAVSLVDDEQDFMWVSGIAPGARIIIRGQDFIREGEKAEAVTEAASTGNAPGKMP